MIKETKLDQRPQKVLLRELTTGDFFGLINPAYLSSTYSHTVAAAADSMDYSVVSQTEVEVYVLAHSVFVEIMAVYPFLLSR